MSPTVREHPLAASHLGERPSPADDTLTSGSRRQISADGAPPRDPRPPRDWRLTVSAICAGVSALIFGIGWFGISGTSEVYEQLPYLLSAGGPGILLIGVALAVYLNHEHTADRIGIALVLERLERLEATGESLVEELNARLETLELAGGTTSSNGSASRSRAGRNG